jgi:hypothetical protein
MGRGTALSPSYASCSGAMAPYGLHHAWGLRRLYGSPSDERKHAKCCSVERDEIFAWSDTGQFASKYTYCMSPRNFLGGKQLRVFGRSAPVDRPMGAAPSAAAEPPSHPVIGIRRGGGGKIAWRMARCRVSFQSACWTSLRRLRGISQRGTAHRSCASFTRLFDLSK